MSGSCDAASKHSDGSSAQVGHREVHMVRFSGSMQELGGMGPLASVLPSDNNKIGWKTIDLFLACAPSFTSFNVLTLHASENPSCQHTVPTESGEGGSRWISTGSRGLTSKGSRTFCGGSPIIFIVLISQIRGLPSMLGRRGFILPKG